MDRVALLCERMEKLADIRPGEKVEFDDDGSVHIIRGWKRWASRKARLGDSRVGLFNDLQDLLELTNDISSGLLGAPRIRYDCLTIGVHDRANNDNNNSRDPLANNAAYPVCAAALVSQESESIQASVLREQFFAQCDSRKKEALERLAAGLEGVCKAINTLMTSTYVEDDTDLGGRFMKLINYATLQSARILSIVSSDEQ